MVIPFALQNLGVLAWGVGDYETGFALEREALVLRRESADKRGIALSMEGLAWLATAKGQPERAARTFGAAEALREALGLGLAPFRKAEHDRCVATIRAQLGEVLVASAWAMGRSCPLDQSIDEALSLDQRDTAEVHLRC